MMITKLLANAGKAGIVMNAALLLTITGCGNNVDAPIPAPAQTPVVVQPSPPALAAPDDYVYYPSYGIYYGNNRHQYAYMHGGDWVAQPAPGGVALDELRASPSVKMDFHDSPANHHAAVVQQYPKNWKPSDTK